MAKYTIYAVDRAGGVWDVKHTDDPVEALRVAKLTRGMTSRVGTAGVYLTDDPESGDVEGRLEEGCNG